MRQEINSSQDRDSNPYSIMMDVAMYDEDNLIMDWLCNSRSESTPILDEYNDNESESPIPYRVIINELGMAEEDVGLLKRKLDFGNSSGKKKRSVGLEEDEEDSVEDFESDSAQGNPTYTKSSDSSSEEGECDDDDDADRDDCARASTMEAYVGTACLTSDESIAYVTFEFKYVPVRLN
ncbi:hypothetical protein ABZP36_002153 [Zizania latifolia]